MKIFCIGRNYVDHAKELNNPIPEQPLVFMKPPTALLRNNDPFYYPDFTQNLHYEVELVLKICKNGKAITKKYASDYFNEIGLGIDFTARDIQDKCKAKGHPWERAKAFDNSACISKFVPIKNYGTDHLSFELLKNDERVQFGNSKDMIFDFETLICSLSKMFTLQKGDLIYTGTPAGVGPCIIGDRLHGKLQGESMFETKIL